MTLARLRVNAAKPEPGRGLLRMPFDRMAMLALQPGDVLSVTGTRKTHARVMPSGGRPEMIEASSDVLANAGLVDGGEGDLGAVSLPDLREVTVALRGASETDLLSVARNLRGLALTEGDRLAYGRGESEIEVMHLDPSPAGLIVASTAIKLQDAMSRAPDYGGIGGLASQIARVHETVATPLLRPDLFERLGVTPPRGVLFTGPPGSGKTLLARSVAARTSAAFFVINGPEIISKHYGETEAALRETFAAARKSAPAIIFIDEIDSIAPRREGLTGERQVERRMVAQLLTLMDGLSDRGQVVVLAATNQPDSIDPALRRPGRFDREIQFTPPTEAERRQILGIHLRDAPLGPDVDLEQIARLSHGCVGADLAALAREAAMAALDRSVQLAGGVAHVQADTLFLAQTDLLHGLQATRPAALRDVAADPEAVTFADVGGMEDAKRMLSEAIIWPQTHRAASAKLKLRTAGGVLLVGPPGSGKTLLARAVAGESGLNFLPLRHERLISPYPGEAERAIARVFAQARQTSPSLVFIDEIDAIAPRRSGRGTLQDRMVGQLLTEMDGLSDNSGVTVVAATNRPAALDRALTRSGRIDTVVRLELPDQSERRAICSVVCRGFPVQDGELLDRIASETEGASAAALAAILKAAARHATRRAISTGDSTVTLHAEDVSAAIATHRSALAALRHDFSQDEVTPDADP